MMKSLRMKLTLAATMAGVLLSGAALARGGGGHGGGGGFHGGGVGGFHGNAFASGGFRGPGFGSPGSFRGAVVARPGFGGAVFVRPGFPGPVFVRPVNRVVVGVGVGVPVFWPYWPGPAYFPPAVVAVPASPPVFIEQGGGQTAQQSFWYWCNDFRAYYPYVKECPGGWQPVVPQAVPPSQ